METRSPSRSASLVFPALVTLLAGWCATPAAAQLGFRDLDPAHPVPIEDAFPVARYAFELLTPWDYVQPMGGAGENQLDLDLTYGVALNWQTGIRLPLAFGPGGESGVAGIGACALQSGPPGRHRPGARAPR